MGMRHRHLVPNLEDSVEIGILQNKTAFWAPEILVGRCLVASLDQSFRIALALRRRHSDSLHVPPAVVA